MELKLKCRWPVGRSKKKCNKVHSGGRDEEVKHHSKYGRG